MILVNLEEIFRLSPKHCHCFVFFQLYRIGLRLEEISEQLDNRLGQVSPRKEAGGATSRWVGVDTTGVCDWLPMNQQLVGWGRVGLVGLLRYMYEHRELNRSFATRANFFVSNQDMSRYSHIFPLTLLHPCACVQSAINPSTFLKRYFRLFLTHILLTTTPPPTITVLAAGH